MDYWRRAFLASVAFPVMSISVGMGPSFAMHITAPFLAAQTARALLPRQLKRVEGKRAHNPRFIVGMSLVLAWLAAYLSAKIAGLISSSGGLMGFVLILEGLLVGALGAEAMSAKRGQLSVILMATGAGASLAGLSTLFCAMILSYFGSERLKFD